MPAHTNISTHAQPLASGRILAPGESTDVALDNDHDRALVSDGALAATETRTDYSSLPAAQLEALAEGAGLEPKGTGADGRVIAADYAKALTANDKKGTA